MRPHFKNNIRIYRAQYNLSQDDLAKKVGVRRETISNLEKGKYNPSLLLALDIASVFNVNVESIFQKLDEKENTDYGPNI
jgi:putative transcriptional regulator